MHDIFSEAPHFTASGLALDNLCHEKLCRMNSLHMEKRGIRLKKAYPGTTRNVTNGRRKLQLLTVGSPLDMTTSASCYFVLAQEESPIIHSFIPSEERCFKSSSEESTTSK
jgi:hypothetical protein